MYLALVLQRNTCSKSTINTQEQLRRCSVVCKLKLKKKIRLCSVFVVDFEYIVILFVFVFFCY